MALAARSLSLLLCSALLSLALLPSSRAQIVFEPPLAADGGHLLARVLAGDVNEDGLPDLLVSHWVFGGKVTLNLGLGGGAFAPPVPVPGAPNAYQVCALADFDGDTHLDLATTSDVGGFQRLVVYFGDGTGGFGGPLMISGLDQNAVDADVGDFNGDGALDIATSIGTLGFAHPRILVNFGDGLGGFDAPVPVVTSPQLIFGASPRLHAGDLNGDGLDDIAFTGTNGPAVRLGLAEGSFAAPSCSSCVQISDRDFVLADVNGDGRQDVVMPSRVLIAQPDGNLALGQVLAGQFPFAIDVGDLDGDGEVDAVIGRNHTSDLIDFNLTTGDVLVLRGNGDGSFQLSGLVVSHVPQPRSVAVSDIDADGRLDAVVAEFKSAPVSMHVLLNHTYGPGSPFLDLGGALAGGNGAPIQLASGTLVGGQPFAFRLANGPANGSAFHVVGLAALNAPFKGGTLIPFPNLVNGPLPLDANGGITLASTWPAGASGLTLWLQFWMPNGGGPAGFVASSGVRAQVP